MTQLGPVVLNFLQQYSKLVYLLLPPTFSQVQNLLARLGANL